MSNPGGVLSMPFVKREVSKHPHIVLCFCEGES